MVEKCLMIGVVIIISRSSVVSHAYKMIIFHLSVLSDTLHVADNTQGCPMQVQVTRLLRKFQSLLSKKLVEESEATSPKPSFYQLLWQRCIDVFVALLLSVSVSCSIFFFVNPKTCPFDYDDFLPFRGQCYHLNKEAKTWYEARIHCQKSGGFLLELYTPSELEYMKRLLDNLGEVQKKTLWLGASYDQNSKFFL